MIRVGLEEPSTRCKLLQIIYWLCTNLHIDGGSQSERYLQVYFTRYDCGGSRRLVRVVRDRNGNKWIHLSDTLRRGSPHLIRTWAPWISGKIEKGKEGGGDEIGLTLNIRSKIRDIKGFWKNDKKQGWGGH